MVINKVVKRGQFLVVIDKNKAVFGGYLYGF